MDWIGRGCVPPRYFKAANNLASDDLAFAMISQVWRIIPHSHGLLIFSHELVSSDPALIHLKHAECKQFQQICPPQYLTSNYFSLWHVTCIMRFPWEIFITAHPMNLSFNHNCYCTSSFSLLRFLSSGGVNILLYGWKTCGLWQEWMREKRLRWLPVLGKKAEAGGQEVPEVRGYGGPGLDLRLPPGRDEVHSSHRGLLHVRRLTLEICRATRL